MRTERWRFIRYAGGGEELYDERNDPYEWTNLAHAVEFDAVKKELAKRFPATNKPAVKRANASDEAALREITSPAAEDAEAAEIRRGGTARAASRSAACSGATNLENVRVR